MSPSGTLGARGRPGGQPALTEAAHVRASSGQELIFRVLIEDISNDCSIHAKYRSNAFQDKKDNHPQNE